jgi:flagellar basal-body rod protein FlgF
MQATMYVALSGQIALERRMETIARNVANISTAGYRADEVKFETVLSQAGKDKVAFATAGETFISRQAGGLTHTNNMLDFAIDGDAWFAIQGENGPAYTRDGRMSIDVLGGLRTIAGLPVLDAGLAPIQLDPAGGQALVSRDGMITQDGEQIAGIGLFRIDNAAKLTRHGNSAVVPNIPAEAVIDFTKTGVVQGYVEGSNVNPMWEMTRLISVSRAFQSASTAISDAERTQQDAIRTLGDTR